MTDFILASASPRRIDLLRSIGLKPNQIIPADINEDPQKDELPKPHALRLSIEKTQKIAKDHPKSLVLAGDTVIACGRRILPKGETEEQARMCLKLLSGRKHKAYTGIAIAYNGKIISRVVTSDVTFKRLTTDEIEHYVQTKEWEGKAGGYGIQGVASAFIKRINGSYTNILGLCTHNTYQMIMGVAPELFNHHES